MSKTNIMRTRRSRFFWILLCILGEQTPQSGIVAVAPRSLALLQVENPLHDVVWLQNTDDSCLGMTGNRLYECGDTTLWYMQAGKHGGTFELRVVDHSMEDDIMTRRERRIRRRTEECLIVNNDSELSVGPCHRKWWRKLLLRKPQAKKTTWELTADGQLADSSGRCIGVDERQQRTRMMDCESSIVWTFLKAQPQENVGRTTTPVIETKPPTKKRPVEPAMFPELKVQSNLLFPRRTAAPKEQSKRPSLPLRLLTNASPMLVAHNKSSVTKIVASSSSSTNTKKTMVSKIQRIQTHPYLNAAKDNVWTDPSTSLDFRTDLRTYLDYDNGRHTLTGVGMYRKYVIKVYGVAFYVSKNSLLEDETLLPYSGLTADELRQRKDFYELLRSPQMNVDRTLLIKTNMQLSAETMRNSLQADWSYLTADAKKLLAETGMRKMPADEKMLHTILDSAANPSRCSCMQTAAPEYRANEECCARGTELAFTWTQENTLEVRLNGRFMASFDRPDIAQGIFYEYLRTDDPISPDLLANVVDGFPFLLAPLNMGISMPSKTSEQHHWWFDHAKNQAIDWAVSARKAVLESAIRTAKGIGEAASHGMEALDRRHILQHIAAAPGTIGKIIQRDEETLKTIRKWMSGVEAVVEEIPKEDNSARIPIRPHHHGLDHLRYYYAGDEIGPLKFHPTINRLALILVHFYLLLLFIVSFPGSSYRIIIRKSREPEPYERRLYLWKDRKSLSYNFV